MINTHEIDGSQGRNHGEGRGCNNEWRNTPRMIVVENEMRHADCRWTEGRVTWDSRGRGNDGILLKTGTAFIDGMGEREVEVGEATSGGVDSDDGTRD